MVTLQSVIEKFKDKGIDWRTTGLALSQSAVTVEGLRKECTDMYKKLLEYHQEQLEYWNTWIDYQKHK